MNDLIKPKKPYLPSPLPEPDDSLEEFDTPEVENQISIKSRERFVFGNIELESSTKSMPELMKLVVDFLNKRPVKALIKNSRLEAELNNLRKMSSMYG